MKFPKNIIEIESLKPDFISTGNIGCITQISKTSISISSKIND